MPGRKQEHLNARIREKLGMLLQREVADPRLQRVTIVTVTVSRDLAHAGVTFSSYDPQANAPELTEVLNKAAGHLGRALARTMETRKTPQLHFTYDPGFDYSNEIELALKRVLPGGEGTP